jgi:hypothetical protein
MKILPIVRSSNTFLPLAERCKKSWDYFHPDIPMHLIKMDDWISYINEIRLNPRNGNYAVIIAIVYAINKMMTEHYDLVIFIDADAVTVGRCSEIISGDFDIAVSNGVTDNIYNNGVWASTNLNFLRDYLYIYNGGAEDDLNFFVNIVRWYSNMGKSIKIVDDKSVWYNERSRYWWDRLIIKNEQLWTIDNNDSRQIKILHWAGGFTDHPEQRMSCSLFSDEVKQWLNRITGGTTFTDHDGKEFGDFLTRTYGL